MFCEIILYDAVVDNKLALSLSLSLSLDKGAANTAFIASSSYTLNTSEAMSTACDGIAFK